MRHAFFHFVFLVSLLVPNIAFSGEWPNWRGPNDNNTLAKEKYPVTWDAETNVRWRAPLPEMGNSSPIVWGQRVFVTQAVEEKGERSLLCFNRTTGKQLWSRATIYQGEEPKHNTNTYCASSPVTDGERVYAYHASAGIFCYDFDGKEIWKRDLGPQIHEFGGGSSPILHGDYCFVYHGPSNDAKFYALDKLTGNTVWEYEEPEAKAPAEREDGFNGSENAKIGSYSTPMVIQSGEREMLIMTFPEWVVALDPDKGTELWRCGGLNPLVYASPVYHNDSIIALGGFHGPGVAVKAGGAGDVTETHRLWKTERGSARLSTPVVWNDKLLFINMTGIGEILDIETGEEIGKARLRAGRHSGPVWGSSVLVGDLLYAVNQRGVTFVMKADPSFEILAANDLGEASNCTPAFSNGDIFIRSENALWCITIPEEA